LFESCDLREDNKRGMNKEKCLKAVITEKAINEE
tara:strand:+ start:564 stop:665 length:102 start_codon:yes stop_codon:yes gene_type:complete